MRQVFLLLHRYVGLAIAAFVIATGLTGAVISWDHELDEWLNPHLIHAPERGASAQSETSPVATPLDYVAQLEATYPQAKILLVPLATEPGHTISYWVEPRFNPETGRLYELDFNQIFVDPATGEELGKRKWGAVWPLSRENFVSFLYKLHYSLHIPEMWGIDHWGVWLLGVVALLWTLDCFVAFYLTLPARRKAWGALTSSERSISSAVAASDKSFWKRWKPSWLVRTKGSAYKLNFDLHRASGLWTWLLAFVIAFTGFSMNLYGEVFEPVMTTLSDVTPSIWTSREERPPSAWTKPTLTFVDILARAPAEAAKQGIDAPPGHIYYSPPLNIYEIEYFSASDGHGSGGVGHPELYFDGNDGRVLGNRKPWTGTAADIFVQAQFPVHSGRILGVPGRILVSLMGLVMALLSVTGVYIWYKKRLARLRAEGNHRGRSAQADDALLALE